MESIYVLFKVGNNYEKTSINKLQAISIFKTQKQRNWSEPLVKIYSGEDENFTEKDLENALNIQENLVPLSLSKKKCKSC